MKPEYKEINYPYQNGANPDHDQVPDEPSTYATSEKYESSYKPNNYEPKYQESEVNVPKYEEKEHDENPYEAPKYEEKPLEPSSYAPKYEVPKYEITPGYKYEKTESTAEPYKEQSKEEAYIKK